MGRLLEPSGIYTEGFRNFARQHLRLPGSILELAGFIGKDRHTTIRRIKQFAPDIEDNEERMIEVGRRTGVYRAVIVDGRLETDAGFVPVVALPSIEESIEYNPYAPEAVQALPDEQLIHLVKTIGEILTERITEL